MKKKILIGCVIFAVFAILALLLALSVSILFSFFLFDDIVVKDYSEEIKTSYGDNFTIKYKEFNFPDSSSKTELINAGYGQKLYFADDPAREWTYLEECYSDNEYNVYFFHESFVFVNENEMIKLPKKDLYENCDLNYTKYPKLIKEIILDGDQGITCLYAEFYLKENDVEIKNRIYQIAAIPESEDPTYYNTITDFKFKRYWHSEHGCEEVIDFSREMVKKYSIFEN